MSTETNSKLKQIDDALLLYCIHLNVTYPRNKYENGPWLQAIIDDGLDDCEMAIEGELGDNCDANDCAYVWVFDNSLFPIPPYAQIPHDQNDAFKFYILQYCYKHGEPPSNRYIQQSIITKCNGTVNLHNKLPEDLHWTEVIHILQHNQAAYYRQFINAIVNQCIQKNWTIYDYNIDELKGYINRFVVTHDQREKMCKEFHKSAQLVAAKTRRNAITIPEGYNDKYELVKKMAHNIKSMRTELDTNDEQLIKLFMNMDSNDVLLINDMILKIKCECVNYGRYNALDDVQLIKIINHYIHLNFTHYLFKDNKLKPKNIKYLEELSIIGKRFLPTADYFGKMKERDMKRKGYAKEYKWDEEKKENINEYGIKYDLGTLQRYVYLFLIQFLKGVLKYDINYSAVYEIRPLMNQIQKGKTFDSFITENIHTINIFDDKYVNEHNLAYCVMDESENVNTKYIARHNTDIGIIISDKEYEKHYENNHWFHLMRAIRSLGKKMGVSIHRFDDIIKIYWHYDGNVLPLILKDITCSKWWTLAFECDVDENVFNEKDWNQDIQPYLRRLFREHEWDKISNYLFNNNYNANVTNWNHLDQPLHTRLVELINRLGNHDGLFKNVYEKLYKEYEEIETDKCTEIAPFKSKYSPDIKLEISATITIQLLIDFNDKFENALVLNKYIKNIFNEQMNDNEIIIFQRNKQQKGIFDLALGNRLYGIIQPFYSDGLIWKLDECRSSKEIFTYFYGLNKLPKVNTYLLKANDDKKEQYDDDSEVNSADEWSHIFKDVLPY